MPYWRLSGFYLFYFASLGALIPYWSLYLKSLSFSASEIGSLLAIIMATKVISPNIWGWIADHTGKRMAIVRLGCLFAAIAFAGVFLSSNFWWMAFIMMLFSFFWNATLPQLEASTFTHLGKETHKYSSVRLWGSIGFVIAVWLIGQQLEGHQISYLPLILIGLFISIWLSSLFVPEEAAAHLKINHESLSEVLKKPAVIALLVVCFLNQFSHGPYYAFYSIYMQSYGYSLTQIGLLWALGVIAEIIVFMGMHKLEPRFGLKQLLVVSMILTSVRWLIIAFFPAFNSIMIFAQILHAASFGLYHAVAIQYVHRFFSGKNQGKGQAIYSSISFGVGGALGSLYAGYAWDTVGSMVAFIIAGVASLAAALITWKRIPA